MLPDQNPTLLVILFQAIVTLGVLIRSVAKERELKGKIKVMEAQKDVSAAATKDEIALNKSKSMSFVESKSLENQSALIGVTGNLADAVLKNNADLTAISTKIASISNDTGALVKSLEDIRQSIRDQTINLGAVVNNRANEISTRMDQLAAKVARENADIVKEVRELMHDIESLPISIRKEVHSEISAIMAESNRQYLPPAPPAKLEIAVVPQSIKSDGGQNASSS